jgi:hypothetical protein
MADCSDIEQTLVTTIAQTLYPNGTGNPSIVTVPCKIYRGWPVPANLDTDLKAGVINPQNNGQNVTRYTTDWLELPVATPALTLTVSGTTVTVGGTPSSPLNAAVLVNRKGYIHAVQPSDTLTTVATALAALINVDTPAASSGAVITIPAAKQLVARVGAVGNVIQEVAREKRGFQITFWCPNPSLRDAIAPPVQVALSSLTFLALPDGTGGRIRYVNGTSSDQVEKSGLYRRDLFYSVEFGTTITQSSAQIIAEIFNITGALDPANPAVISFTI